MENATKALLIAAAVLVAIIIISLGVYVVSLAQNQMKGAESGLNDVEIQSFNSTYKSYEGTSVSGTKVKALVDAVYNHNLTESDESRKIEMEERTLQVVMTTMGNMEYARGKSSGRKNTLQLMNQAMTWSGISNETIQHIMQAYRQLEKVDKL